MTVNSKLRCLRRRAADESGFTLIELLVVAVIVGVLAAIAIPSFLSQTGKAQDAQAKFDARTAATAMETYYLDMNTYDASISDLQGIEKALTNSTISSAKGDDEGFTVKATSKSGNVFTFKRKDGGEVDRKCDRAGDGGCPKAGTW